MSEVFKIINKEKKRQKNNIELIASENFVSKNILKAVGSCLTNKYAEGYPQIRKSGNIGRYYGGCQYVDEIENYCYEQWQKVFHTDYHVNVQPHSGSQANLAVYQALLKPNDTILSMSLDKGGHLSHGASVNQSGKLYNIISYSVTKDGFIDYQDMYQKIYTHRPNLILVGASAYPRIIDFRKIKDLIDQIKSYKGFENYNPYYMVDMAHIAGLIAGGQHPSPFGIADVITTTTHKTLRGPRGGLIFCKTDLAKKIDSAIFPCTQGGPLMHIIAGKAICAEEAQTIKFQNYAKQVVNNCKAMAKTFIENGINLVTNGTDNHLLLIDLSNTNWTGLELQEYLDTIGITLNKNCIPNEKLSPKVTSGVRIGTAAMTTRGWKEKDFIKLAKKISKIIKEK